jgi:hypothetical protein
MAYVHAKHERPGSAHGAFRVLILAGEPNLVGFACAGLNTSCPYFYEELEAWKARPAAPPPTQ